MPNRMQNDKIFVGEQKGQAKPYIFSETQATMIDLVVFDLRYKSTFDKKPHVLQSLFPTIEIDRYLRDSCNSNVFVIPTTQGASIRVSFAHSLYQMHNQTDGHLRLYKSPCSKNTKLQHQATKLFIFDLLEDNYNYHHTLLTNPDKLENRHVLRTCYGTIDRYLEQFDRHQNQNGLGGKTFAIFVNENVKEKHLLSDNEMDSLAKLVGGSSSTCFAINTGIYSSNRNTPYDLVDNSSLALEIFPHLKPTTAHLPDRLHNKRNPHPQRSIEQTDVCCSPCLIQ